MTAPTRRRPMLVGAFLLVTLLVLLSGQRWTPASEPLVTAGRVLVVGVGPLGFDDLHQGATPRLDALVDADGAVAALSTRTRARRSTLAEGYLSLGAGERLPGDTSESVAYDAVELAALPEQPPAAEGEPAGAVTVVGASEAATRSAGDHYSSAPGALAAALHAAGHSIAVVGNADVIDAKTGLWVPRRPAALAAMGPDLVVDAGVVARSALLEEDPQAPFGVRASIGATAGAASALLAEHDVVFVDPGELSRFDSWTARHADEVSDAEIDAARTAALARTDAVLGALVDDAPDDVLVLVVSLAAPGPGLHLAPLVATGAGVTPGRYLVSPATKRAGVVAITDLAPTILSGTGTDVPDDLVGSALRLSKGDASLGRLERLDDETAFRERTYGDWTQTFLDLHVVVYGLAAVVLLVTALRARPLRRVVRVAALLLAGFPLATYLVRLLPSGWATASWALALVLAIDAVLVAGALRFRRRPSSPVLALLGATVAVLIADAATGTQLQLNTWLGISFHNGARFYGLGNTTFGLLTGGALLLVAGLVGGAPAERRGDALLGGGLLLALVAVVEGSPTLGSDVGGILTVVPAAGALLLVLSGRRIRWPAALGLAGITAALLAVATVVDLLRPAEARTHLGRFASDALEDPSTVWDTFTRKLSSNIDLFGTSPWVRLLVVTGAFLAVVLFERQRRDAILPPGSPERVGAVVTVGAAVLGLLVNDSGPIIIAMFCAYLLPYVLLPALEAVEPAAGDADAEGGPREVRRGSTVSGTP